ncbi:hypothetical protein SAMN06265348_107325 [Pedobacter westerhofensis]|uniref:Uncharacterized protein n=1 Tax=Pedobacter westerhofensis TaxID=425512 RepID=A0A521EC07_9SPHI|nr:hypothetical protein [Pedobacter westerhofensis]SMO81001.1 hypothetical protein SAMN06265348_107325 [Pedobacter westerhofensis]
MKRVIFSALLATVAIGGAITSYAQQYQSPTNKVYTCPASTGPLCINIPENIRPVGSSGSYLPPSSYNFEEEQYTVQ